MTGPEPEPPTATIGGTAARSRAGRRGYWIPGIIALTVLVVMALALGAGDLFHPAPAVLSGAEVEQQLALGIQAQGGYARPPVVHCPGPQPVARGHTFACTLDGPKGPVGIRVVEIDARGQLRWSSANG